MGQSMALPEECIQVRLGAGEQVIRREEPGVDVSLHTRLSVYRVEGSAQPVRQADLRNACKPMRRKE